MKQTEQPSTITMFESFASSQLCHRQQILKSLDVEGTIMKLEAETDSSPDFRSVGGT